MRDVTGADIPPNTDTSKTSSDLNSHSWATACVFQPGATAPSPYGGRIWSQGQGYQTNNTNIMLVQIGTDIYFQWGKTLAENSIRVIENADPNKWYGVYVAHKGARYYYPNANLLAPIGLMRNVDMPTSDDAKKMITDPVGWESDLIGTTQRSYTAANYTYSDDTVSSALSHQVYLMGDGANDSFSNGIRNEVLSTDQNYTKMEFNNMTSNDIENITIPGLS
jgi:hypothetical protein